MHICCSPKNLKFWLLVSGYFTDELYHAEKGNSIFQKEQIAHHCTVPTLKVQGISLIMEMPCTVRKN